MTALLTEEVAGNIWEALGPRGSGGLSRAGLRDRTDLGVKRAKGSKEQRRATKDKEDRVSDSLNKVSDERTFIPFIK